MFKRLLFNKISTTRQFLISISIIFIVTFLCFSFLSFIDYRGIALILLMFVSLIAMFFDIIPVIAVTILSVFAWVWFFIPPIFTWVVKSTEDRMMIFMYFIIALVHIVLTIKIREVEKATNREEERENTLKLYNTIMNSLSHELRTPIATILGATDNLQSGNTQLTERMKDELIIEISKASLRLNSQVENLLNMSRLESNFIQIKIDWCDVNELIHEVVNGLKDRLENRKIEVLIQENIPLCRLDYGLIQQVFQNLIINSHIYTSKDCEIIVTANYLYNELIFTVEDDGQGFPDFEIRNVFDKFYRLNKTKTGGTGLGLSIVKGYVEAHNGSVALMNKVKGGAKFTIKIPSEINDINSYENE
jgi:two-component system sensor histidine kinase KdpD